MSAFAVSASNAYDEKMPCQRMDHSRLTAKHPALYRLSLAHDIERDLVATKAQVSEIESRLSAARAGNPYHVEPGNLADVISEVAARQRQEFSSACHALLG